MSDRLFSPTYRVPGVTYKNENDISNSSSRHLHQPRPQRGGATMSVGPNEDNGLPNVEVEMVNRHRVLVGPPPSQDTGGKLLNPNSYATRKTVAQGMLDIALLTANASQLRYVLSLGERHENYSLMVGLIVTSLVLQALSGITNSVLVGLNINKESMQVPANILNIISSGLAMLVMANDLIIMGMGGGSSLRANSTARPTNTG